MQAAGGKVAAVVREVGVLDAYATPPSCMLDMSVDAGTMTSDNLCGKYGCMATSYTLIPCLHDI